MQDTEMLIANMLLERFLDKSYTSNAYKVQVYIKPGTRTKAFHPFITTRTCGTQQPPRKRGLWPWRETQGGGRAIKRISSGAGAVGGDGSEEDDDVDADADIVVDYSGDNREEEGRMRRHRRRSSNQHQHQSSSWVTSSAAAALDVDLDLGGNLQEVVVPDSEPEREGVEWKGNLRGVPAATHRSLRSDLRSRIGMQRKMAGASWPAGASGNERAFR